MDVRTVADEHRDSAREHVAAATRDLCAILAEDCWGHDEYSEDYQKSLEEAFVMLRKVKRLLG
jgi:hypothetical protein